MDNLKIIPAHLKEAAGKIEIENSAVQNISRRVNAAVAHLPIGRTTVSFDHITSILFNMKEVLNKTANAFENADKEHIKSLKDSTIK
ncbi:hypothetical protein [Scopulibacillus cellulosilyticus]|uniref:Type VII secretion effector (TIGR04197 family) n=1 Tax=Scopulibacillus cellulosilyticus TaxID=2665665 RepID=A0ABW2PUU2_9BACL